MPFDIFFEKVSSTMGENLSIPERRYIELFTSFGVDLSTNAIRSFTKEEAKKGLSWVPDGMCHNVAFQIITQFKKHYPSVSAKLYWGYIDQWSSDKYEGSYEHSFLTICLDGDTVLFDPVFSRYVSENNKTRFYSHFGIQIPIDVLNRITLIAKMHGRNYAGYIKNVIVQNSILFDEFKREIQPHPV